MENIQNDPNKKIIDLTKKVCELQDELIDRNRELLKAYKLINDSEHKVKFYDTAVRNLENNFPEISPYSLYAKIYHHIYMN